MPRRRWQTPSISRAFSSVLFIRAQLFNQKRLLVWNDVHSNHSSAGERASNLRNSPVGHADHCASFANTQWLINNVLAAVRSFYQSPVVPLIGRWSSVWIRSGLSDASCVRAWTPRRTVPRLRNIPRGSSLLSNCKHGQSAHLIGTWFPQTISRSPEVKCTRAVFSSLNGRGLDGS